MEIRHPPLYSYAPLLATPNSIRLVRLLPSSLADSPIHCQLFNYSLSTPKRNSHLYACLSYCWGSLKHKQSIIIDGARLNVNQNLHAALLRLRDPDLDHVLWIDAICINQDDLKERAQQVQFMAMIFACANRVVVWLGEEKDGSSEAMDIIRSRATQKARSEINFSANGNSEDQENVAVMALLQRPWFQRIWVLQEVAAAQTLTFICGPKEISGSCFHMGIVPSLCRDEKQPGLQSAIASLLDLLRRTGLPDPQRKEAYGQFRLDIRPLAQLLDMFRTREATDRRDKIYALLGMSRLEPEAGILLPDYERDWLATFQALVRTVLGKKAKVTSEVWRNQNYELITSKGSVLGYISEAHGITSITQEIVVASRHLISKDSVLGGREFTDSKEGPYYEHFSSREERIAFHRKFKTNWNLHCCAAPAREGDVLCLLKRATEPTIIRPQGCLFAIIAMAVQVPNEIRVTNFLCRNCHDSCNCTRWITAQVTWSEFLTLQLSFQRRLLLTWSWDSDFGLSFENCEMASAEADFHIGEISSLAAYSDTARVVEDTGWKGEDGIGDIVNRATKIQKELSGENYPTNVHLQHLETLVLPWKGSCERRWKTYMAFKEVVKSALGQWEDRKASDSDKHDCYYSTTSLYPDLVEIQGLFNTDTRFVERIAWELGVQARAATSQPGFIEEYEILGHNKFLDVLVFLLDHYGHYVSPGHFVYILNAIPRSRPPYPELIIDFLEVVIDMTENHPSWGISFLQQFFEQLPAESHIVYSLLELAITQKDESQSWSSPVAAAALGSCANTLSKVLSASKTWEYVAQKRPYDSILDFIANNIVDEGKRWLDKQNERFDEFYMDCPRGEQSCRSMFDTQYLDHIMMRKFARKGSENLKIACIRGDPLRVKHLLTTGKARVHLCKKDDRNSIFKDDQKGFHVAFREGQTKCCKLLLAFGFRAGAFDLEKIKEVALGPTDS